MTNTFFSFSAFPAHGPTKFYINYVVKRCLAKNRKMKYNARIRRLPPERFFPIFDSLRVVIYNVKFIYILDKTGTFSS